MENEAGVAVARIRVVGVGVGEVLGGREIQEGNRGEWSLFSYLVYALRIEPLALW